MIWRVWAHAPLIHLEANSGSQEAALEAQHNAIHRLCALFPSWPSDSETSSLPGKGGGPLTTRPLAAVAPYCLNFSVRPCQTPSLSTTTSHGHLPFSSSCKVFQDSLSCGYSSFSNF
jgi:hypothetical protein